MGGLKKQVEGAGKAAMGKAQEEAGKAIHDPGMEARGKEKEAVGMAELKLGQVQDKVRKEYKEHKDGR